MESLWMARKQKPEPDLVAKAAKALKNPKTASLKTVQRMAAVVLDDEQYDPQLHRPKSKSR
jgi:beta-phosphoglucomutase-like phosphatase (HAD superfamily)